MVFPLRCAVTDTNDSIGSFFLMLLLLCCGGMLGQMGYEREIFFVLSVARHQFSVNNTSTAARKCIPVVTLCMLAFSVYLFLERTKKDHELHSLVSLSSSVHMAHVYDTLRTTFAERLAEAGGARETVNRMENGIDSRESGRTWNYYYTSTTEPKTCSMKFV